MIIILALVLTLVLAAIGVACVRAYALTRPDGFGGGLGGAPVRGYARPGLQEALGRSPGTLFGGRRWAILGCYSALAMVIFSLVILDGMLLFLISVARG